MMRKEGRTSPPMSSSFRMLAGVMFLLKLLSVSATKLRSRSGAKGGDQDGRRTMAKGGGAVCQRLLIQPSRQSRHRKRKARD